MESVISYREPIGFRIISSKRSPRFHWVWVDLLYRLDERYLVEDSEQLDVKGGNVEEVLSLLRQKYQDWTQARIQLRMDTIHEGCQNREFWVREFDPNATFEIRPYELPYERGTTEALWMNRKILWVEQYGLTSDCNQILAQIEKGTYHVDLHETTSGRAASQSQG
jgi:hypothetical protein